MKLHLPTRLRKALVATFVAVASLATTLSTGTLVGGVAAVSLASVVSAAVVGPAETYADGSLPEGIANASTVTLTATEDTVWNVSSYKGLNITIDAKDQDVKLTGRTNTNDFDNNLDGVTAASLWLADGGFLVNAADDVSGVSTIYLGGAQMQLIGDQQLSNDFVLGACSAYTSEDSLSRAALRIGHWQHTDKEVVLTGDVTVQENASIAFQHGCDLVFSGTLLGSGNLSMKIYNNSSYLKLAGDSSAYTGVVSADSTSITLKLGNAAAQTGGLNGSFALGLDTVTASTLTLDVAESASLSHTGTVAAGISLVKNGEGSQSFISAIVGDVTVNAGTLTLLSVTGDVMVAGGTIKLQSMEGLTSMTVKSGATAYLPGVSVSSTATDWVQDSVYYTAAAGGVDMSLVTLEEGGSVLSSGGAINAANADDCVYVEVSCLSEDGSLTVERGNVMVCDPNNITAVAQSIASASKIILDGGTLFSVSQVWAGETVNYVVDADLEIKSGNGGGTLRAYGSDATSLTDSTTYTGAVTGNGRLHKTDGGRVILSGSLSGFSGDIDLAAGILDIAGDTSTNVLISGGGTLYISGNLTKGGDQTIQTNARILSGGKLITANKDMLDWGGGKTITLEEGGELVVNHRQTAGGVHFVLNGGTISGPGGNDVGEYRGLDIHEGATSNMQVTANSLVNTPIKVRNSGSTLNAKVDADKVLSISNRVFGDGKLNVTPYSTTEGAIGGTVSITGSGVLECGSAILAANTTLDFNTTGDSTHSAAITGVATSKITKSGASAITLSGVTDFAGVVSINGGSLGFSQAATLGSLATNGGALLVDAGLETPAVLTLGVAPTAPITLLVKNVASIGTDGVRVFADGTPMPTSVNVESAIVTDDTGSYKAIYADGVLTKTAVAAATAGNLTWKTDGSSDNWGSTTAENWTKDSTAQRWVDGSTVTFAGTGESISVVSAVTADSATVTGTGYEWVLGADKLTITNGVTIAENASLTIKGLTNTGDAGNYNGVVTGAGTLVLKSLGVKGMGDVSGAISGAEGKAIASVEIADGSALQWSSSSHVAALNNVTNFIVSDGGRFDHRMNNSTLAGDGKTLTISGAGSSSLAGPAAALTFGYDCGTQANFHVARSVTLAGDATVWVRSGATSNWTGGLDTENHTLSLIGGGTLYVGDSATDGSNVVFADVSLDASTIKLDMREESMNNVSMSNGSTLEYYRIKANSEDADPSVAGHELAIQSLAVDSAATLKISNHAADIQIGALSGSGTLNVVFGQTSDKNSRVMVGGSTAFSGVVNLSQTDTTNADRVGYLMLETGTVFSSAVLNVQDVADAGSGKTHACIIALGAAETELSGLSSGSGVSEAEALIVSNLEAQRVSDDTVRTLKIVGGGTNSFGGTVMSGLNLLMNGTGSQSFTGNLDAFDGTIGVQKGTLNLAGVGSASAISLAGGTTLGVTAGVSGKSLSVDAVGAVLSADLTMAGGSLALGTADTQWAKEGGLSLDSHKLVLDSANKGALSVNLGTEDYTGEVVQLFTNVTSIEDAAGNAISITGATKVGDLFNTGTDVSLADYLLNWDSSSGILSLVMKGEVADLVWNDDSAQNVWKTDGAYTNWKDGSNDSRFVVGDNVSFSGTGETVTIEGSVAPLNVTVSAGDYTWDGSGSVEAGGKLTVADNAQLTIANSGNKKFTGGVEVGNSAVLSVENLTGWSGTVSGAGCFELATGADVGALSQFVSSEKELGMLLLYDDGTSLSVSSADESLISKVGTVQVVEGANVKVTNDTQLDTNLTLDAARGASFVEVAADKTATLSGKFIYFSSADAVAAIKGAGTLVLTGGASNNAFYEDLGMIVSNEVALSVESGTLKIDAANSTVGVHRLGAVSGAGTLLLSNGSVEVSSLADTMTVNVATETAGDVVNVSGIDGSALDSITLVQGSQLTGVTGDITVGAGVGTTSAMALTLDAANVGTSATIADGKNAMIGQTGKLVVNDGSTITLSVDAITSLLNQAANNAESVYLHLTTGTLDIAADVLDTLVFQSGATSIDLLESFGVRLNGTEAGSLVLSGGANGVYSVADDTVVNGYKELSAYQSTVVAPDTSLELMLDGAAEDGSTAVINNLIGGTDGLLLINNTDDASMARVELKNTLQNMADPDPAEAVGADTEFAGDINGTGGVGDVEIVISGDGTLTVDGNVNTAQLTMSAGGLTLNGSDNTITTLADDGVAAGAAAADSTLTVNDLLTVEGESELTGTSVAGDGTLSLKDTLKLSDAAALDGVAVELQKDNFGTIGALALDGVQGSEVSALSGAGSLQGGNGADLTVTGKGGSFSGSLDALAGANDGATLKIAEGASQTLDRATGSTAWSVENAGELTLNITNPSVTSGSGTNKPLTLDTLTMKSGSTTTMVINTDAPANYLNLQELVVEDGATVALQSTGLDEVDFGGSITLAYAANGVTVGDDVNVELGNSAAFKKVKEAELVSSADGKSLVLQTTYHDTNQYEQMTSSGNGAAGAALLWSVNTGALPNGSALKAVDEAVNELYKEGTSSAASQAEKIMAAVAGSSTAILGSALSSDVERQLRAIRNRTTTMGVGQCEVNEGMPYFNAWLNAEGDHHEMDADGLAAGYTRDSWGGTVGFDVDLTPNLTMGLAVTAMYGDIESDSADKAEGDFDTQYVSLFARYASSAWTHTFVATVGRADMTLDRTVNFTTGRYDTEGETEGTSFGFMYEVGRVISLTEDGDVCLQPVANVTFRHSSVDGYEESGCDATLAVDEQTYTAVTLGVGARLQAVIGTSLYNRASILEARALAKFDMGDRESEADVRLTQGGDTATVKSAEVGAFGAEFGVGVTVPMGANAGSIFVDGSAEIRSGYTNINGTVGYRINF